LSKVSSVASILETLLSSLTITSNATISIQLSEEIVSQFSTLSEIIFASGKKSLNIYVCHPLKFF
jgi:ABC-type hemin transport system substrate-binding protein